MVWTLGTNLCSYEYLAEAINQANDASLYKQAGIRLIDNHYILSAQDQFSKVFLIMYLSFVFNCLEASSKYLENIMLYSIRVMWIIQVLHANLMDRFFILTGTQTALRSMCGWDLKSIEAFKTKLYVQMFTEISKIVYRWIRIIRLFLWNCFIAFFVHSLDGFVKIQFPVCSSVVCVIYEYALC